MAYDQQLADAISEIESLKARLKVAEKELAAMKQMLEKADSQWEVAWYAVGQNLVSNRASREVCFRRGFTKGTQWVLKECASILALTDLNGEKK